MAKLLSSWELRASVLLQKGPRVPPPLTPIESRLKDVLSSVEIQKSSPSKHELRVLRDATQKSTRLAIDDEDAWKEEFDKFAAKIPDSDRDHRPLRLSVKTTIGDNDNFVWTLPSTAHREEDGSLRVTAERALRESLGNKVRFQLLGNAPWSFYNLKYSRNLQEKSGLLGRKVFLFKGYYVDGDLEPQNDITHEISWNLIEEMKGRLIPKEFKAVNSCIWNED